MHMSKPAASAKGCVVVGMSGGVDSSVTAALLMKEGYEVIGATLLLGCGEVNTVCSPNKAVEDAQRVAQRLGIPHHVLDLQSLFAEKVVDYFTAEYLRGRTPNPCVACNRHIKFGAFFERARDMGAQYVATGHYAKIEYDNDTGRYLLYRAQDKSKDQSYVLYNLSQEQLRHMLLPLGRLTKKETREIAQELGLEVFNKPESQEICFIPDDDYKRFVTERVPEAAIKPGLIRNSKGEVLGTHRGLPYYTVGQRKGLGLALGYPVYVVSLDAATNSVIVGTDEEIYQKGLWSKDNSFIAFRQPVLPLEVEAKIRYTAEPAPAEITGQVGERLQVLFKKPQRAITPGQSVVYYRGDLVIGGGVIDEVIR